MLKYLYISGHKWFTTHPQSAQFQSNKSKMGVIYVIMKTRCPPGFHHNGFVATLALVYIYICIHIYDIYIWYIYMIYIYDIYNTYILYIYIYIYYIMYLLCIYLYILYIYIFIYIHTYIHVISFLIKY